MTPSHLHVREWIVRGNPKSFPVALRAVANHLLGYNALETATLVLDAVRRGEELPDETPREREAVELIDRLMCLAGIQAFERIVGFCSRKRSSFKLGRPRAEEGPRDRYGQD